MLWGASLGALELRSEGGETRLRATFPYGAETELAPGRREIIAPCDQYTEQANAFCRSILDDKPLEWGAPMTMRYYSA